MAAQVGRGAEAAELGDLSIGRRVVSRSVWAWARRWVRSHFSGVAPVTDCSTHEPALRRLGPGTTYLGADHGLASPYDVALLGIMWGTMNSFLHGAALLETAQVDAATFAPFANQDRGRDRLRVRVRGPGR